MPAPTSANDPDMYLDSRPSAKRLIDESRLSVHFKRPLGTKCALRVGKRLLAAALVAYTVCFPRASHGNPHCLRGL
jgi:hypothetical protein